MGKFYVALVALSLVGLQLVFASQVEGSAHDLYDRLCQNKDIEFTRLSEAGPLIEFAKSAESLSVGCDPLIREAILDLEEPLQVDDPDNYCTPLRVNRIIAYISKHIKAQSPSKEVPDPEAPEHLPAALKRFFIGYSLDISKICKLGMIELLHKDTRDHIDKDDQKEILRWTEDKDVFSQKFLGRASNYDDMFLVGNAICDDGIQNCRKLYIQTEYWKKIFEMRKTCHRVFKPFYEKLILPMVRLANVGIDYQGKDIQDQLDDFREDAFLQKWYKVVYICESILNVVALDLPKSEKAGEFHIDEKILKQLDEADIKDEAKDLEEEVKAKAEAEAAAEAQPEVVEVEIVETDEPCDSGKKDTGDASKVSIAVKKSNEHEEIIEFEECKEGKKVLKKQKKHKTHGNFLTKFVKDIVKETKKLQQERRNYILSRKNMPVTRIMLKKEVEAYKLEHGQDLPEEAFGDAEPIEYSPKPRIRLSDDLIPAQNKMIRKAIKQYEVKKRNWKRALRRLTKKYERLLRKYLFLGRVKFGGKSKEDIGTDELMMKVFDTAMWEKNNRELVESVYGKFRTFMDFQNVSNLATWLSMILGIVFFILGAVGACSG